MSNEAEIKLKHIFWLPNLLSLSRLLITPLIGYLLWRNDALGIILCLAFLTLAGITDFLDGFLARKLNKISPLGIALDPVADKIMAIILIVELIYFRDFPIWLAVSIIGRDILIVLLGLILMRGKKVNLPSNNTGKYYFSAIVVLIASYIMRFEFGIAVFIPITVGLLILSTWFYARRYFELKKSGAIGTFDDRPIYKIIRTGLTLIISAVYLFRLYIDIVNPALS